MKKALLFIALFCVIAYCSCHTLLKMAYGITEPKVENAASLEKFAQKKGLSTGNIVTIAASEYKSLQHIMGGLPEIAVFDHEGNYIEYKPTDSSCNAFAFDFIKTLDKNAGYTHSNKMQSLSVEMTRLRDMNGNPIAANYLRKDVDFYVLIFWAKYTGRLNKDHVKVWEIDAAQNKKASIQVIKVNADLQEYWGKTALNSIMVGARDK